MNFVDALRRLDPGSAAPLAPDDFIALLERAFALAILAWLLLVGALGHGVLSIDRGSVEALLSGNQRQNPGRLSH
jgi:hypothetical protein